MEEKNNTEYPKYKKGIPIKSEKVENLLVTYITRLADKNNQGKEKNHEK